MRGDRVSDLEANREEPRESTAGEDFRFDMRRLQYNAPKPAHWRPLDPGFLLGVSHLGGKVADEGQLEELALAGLDNCDEPCDEEAERYQHIHQIKEKPD